MKMHSQYFFGKFAKRTSRLAGHPVSFLICLLIIILWGVSGFFFDFSDTWQLIINTATTVITFLMVFLIQNTQNREGEAIQLKLDELIRAIEGAHNALLDLEELTEADLDRIRSRYIELAKKARLDLQSGREDTGHPPIDTH